ncbi:MAG: chorismate synthase [Clostridia bacterium]|nr:chorismate synthase [Clostridia bacterium]
MPDFSIGDKLRVTIFGQSHGPAVGCVIDGFPAGQAIDWNAVNAFLVRRAPGQNAWSTPRKEADAPEIVSGLNEAGKTCGAPITALIRNTNTRSQDYPDLVHLPRPGHADFAATLKYGDAWDYRGGGFFSARLTAPLCFAGALCLQYLSEKGIRVSAHIARIGGILDAVPDTARPALPLYEAGAFPVIDPGQGEKMKQEIENARQMGDSVDGSVRCIVTGFPAGIGGPYFGGLEGKLSQALFGIPAMKGILFGDPQTHGSENNDVYGIESGKAIALTNHAGGILGGISTGLPLHFTVSFKPTPSIARPQQTVNLQTMEESALSLQGRHDPCVVPRAVPVVEAVTALVLTDLLLQ